MVAPATPDRDERAIDPPRKPWVTPAVIVSELRRSGAHVANGSDGSSELYGPYGS